MVSPSNVVQSDLQSLLQQLPKLNPREIALIEKAYRRAEIAHEGQIRKSGEPYLTHCVEVARILAELHMDAETIAAGLLHDVVEDNDAITDDDLKDEFGEKISALVSGVTNLKHIKQENQQKGKRYGRRAERNKESIRKMLLTMDDDIEVVFVKLADRLHNMRTLGYMKEEKQKDIAQETLDIYAPLANRLGIWQIKWELEDLAFRYLHPEEYRAIARSLDERRNDRESYVNEVIQRLQKELKKLGVENAHITGRPKHIYSIFNKMQRKTLPLEEIYDVRAVRIIVDKVSDCYLVLGAVHGLWRPIQSEFDDYISAPKDNFYQSLHTAVRNEEGKTLEVQIRTWEMHENAEYGLAAHWRYKEGRQRQSDKAFEDRVAHIRRKLDASDVSDDTNTVMQTVEDEFFQEQIFVLTPNTDVIELPMGSTPIDFAYRVHTEIGHRCRGAKVNGRLVPLNYKLKTEDTVEILTAKRGGPSRDWLNEDLEYVQTNRARAKIRQWLKKQDRELHITMGRDTLERDLRRLGLIDKLSYESILSLFPDFDKLDDFFTAIGSGDLSSGNLSNRILKHILDEEETKKPDKIPIRPRPRSRTGGTSGSA